MAAAIMDDPVEKAVTVLQDGGSGAVVDLTGGKARSLDDEDIERLVEGWAGNTTCTTLDLSINQITDVGGKTLADALAGNTETVLTSLELDSNKLTSEGAAHIINALPASITRFDLSANLVDDSVIQPLVDRLSKGELPKLQALLLRDNPKFTNQALTDLSAFLETADCNLTSLHVSGNDFTDDAIPALANAIKANKTLIDLNVCNTSFVDPLPLVDALQENEEIRKLSIARGGLKQDLGPLTELLNRNKKIWRRRQDVVSLLKHDHAVEMEQLKAKHQKEVDELRAEINRLKEERNPKKGQEDEGDGEEL